MGNVKDRYFKYAENGDQFVGRCLSMLPILHVDFAISPPYFSDRADNQWVTSIISLQFGTLKNITEFGLLLRMCLASLLHHCKFIDDMLSFNHVVKTSSICYRNRLDLERVQNEGWTVVSYPWGDKNKSFSGIPPYHTILQHVDEVRVEQKNLCLSFISKVKEALSEYGVNAGTLSEERVTVIMDEFYRKFEDQLARLVFYLFFFIYFLFINFFF
jgi:hypothetical protein